MALTPEEVKRMEEQADLSDRFNRAADRYVAGNNPGLRAAEREQVLRGREADVFSAARQRRINANRDIAASDPGRFSAFETRSLLGLQHTQGGDIARNDIDERSNLRQHELDMLKQTGENEFKVAEQKRLGMKEQGSNAAGLNAEATKYGWNKQLEMEQKRQEGLTEREKMIGDRTERIAGMEHGTIGPDGTVTPGSRERVAGINADAVAQQAELKRQHELELEREKTLRNADTNQTRVVVGASHDQARRDAAGLQQQRADQNARNRIVQDINKGAYIASGMSPDKWKQMSPEEQEAYINGLMPNQPNNTNNPQPPARRSWRDRYGAANK